MRSRSSRRPADATQTGSRCGSGSRTSWRSPAIARQRWSITRPRQPSTSKPRAVSIRDASSARSVTLHWQGGDRKQATDCYARALLALDGAARIASNCRICTRSSDSPRFGAETINRRSEWAERALSSAEAAHADSAAVTPGFAADWRLRVAHATNTIGVALARSGQLDAARQRIEESVAVAHAARVARCGVPRVCEPGRPL